MKARTGKRAADIFSPVATAPAPSRTVAGPGKHGEPYTKATVVLFTRQTMFLDELAWNIRKSTGQTIARAEILRALVDALEASGIDATGAGSEAELRELFTRRLTGGK